MRIVAISVILIITGACSAKPFIVKSATIPVSSAQEVYVVNHGWHTGFVVPADIITKQLPRLHKRFKDVPFIEFGWGDKGFYQAEEITSGLTLQAIFWPTESVIHTVAITESVEKYFPHSQIEVLCLQSRQYSKLIGFIENSFSKNNHGNILPLKSGIYGNSQFYKGTGDYYLMNTCNKWTAKGLSSAEMNISTTFKLTAGSIMDYLSEQSRNAINEDAGGC